MNFKLATELAHNYSANFLSYQTTAWNEWLKNFLVYLLIITGCTSYERIEYM